LREYFKSELLSCSNVFSRNAVAVVSERLERLVEPVSKSKSQEVAISIFDGRTEPCELHFLNGSGQTRSSRQL
jgi:hypothetical protein